MGIGFSVFLLALGAILAFAVQDSTVYGIDLDVVGIQPPAIVPESAVLFSLTRQ